MQTEGERSLAIVSTNECFVILFLAFKYPPHCPLSSLFPNESQKKKLFKL